MRLLDIAEVLDSVEVLDTAKVKVRRFEDNLIPPYAIISHTWDEKEITFQDMVRAHGKKKEGYEKVKKSCSVAAADGFKYVWRNGWSHKSQILKEQMVY